MLFRNRLSFARFVFSVLLLAGPAFAQSISPEAGKTAEAVMAQVKSEAAAQHKGILLTFGASWCGNCRLFDKFLTDPAMHTLMTKAFVFADLDTGERPDDPRHANIPGGQKLQASLGGKTAGYPYIVMLDAAGKPLADSVAPAATGHPGNIGYPDAPYEIDWFVEMLKKSAPALTPADLGAIHSWLSAHSSSHR
jgi:thiol-disulfide isomerase/thioredoxin